MRDPDTLTIALSFIDLLFIVLLSFVHVWALLAVGIARGVGINYTGKGGYRGRPGP